MNVKAQSGILVTTMGPDPSLVADHDPVRLLNPEEREHASAADGAPLAPSQAHRCGNCDAMLSGPYCATCGQHAHASARNLAAVLHDGWHDLTHVDGRLWLTLWLLLSGPGRLTVDYFRDRRARYLPPVRLYLVLSLIFFSFNLGSGSDHRATTHAKPDSAIDSLGCADIKVAGMRSLERWAHESCQRVVDDGGATFLRTLLHNVPKMMFVFLPLMAGIMRLLYWRPTRYYVEHLVFLLHNHCALYLCFVLLTLVEMLGNAGSPFAVLANFAGTVGACYVVWYPYAAMRRYYTQSRWVTAAKFAVVGCAYFACLLVTLLATVIVTALDA